MKLSNSTKKTRFLPSTIEAEKSHPILSSVLQDATVNKSHDLHLAMLGCESNPPYGPNEHTAQLLLDTIALAARQHFQEEYDKQHTDATLSPTIAKVKQHCQFSIHIHIFDMQKSNDYPGNWNAYDGFLLPGSFSSAQDRMPWIFKLQNMLQKELVAKQRPTLAICFGHQLLAKSFRRGKMGRLKDGVLRVGRHVMQTSIAGKHLFEGKEQVNLYYTNSETVKKLPDTAVCLGGSGGQDDDDDDDDDEPIQAAAYFASSQDANQWCEAECNGNLLPRPFAITFQGHPEYACSRKLGLEGTFRACLNDMEQRGVINVETKKHATEDTSSYFELVQEDSIHVMVRVGRWLGWFPMKETKNKMDSQSAGWLKL